ncbi:MAG: hypothetical protein E6G94_14285 [Alphaproteobacteria bacterium]|nr:MAG: hypothetical protein E6G94_14285 [Alphaproteobacteria bacterium]
MTGAERARATADMIGSEQPQWTDVAPVEPVAVEEARPRRSAATKILGALLILLAIAWIGAAGWSVWQSNPVPTLPNIVGWIAGFSAPLVLLALLWVAFGRSSRRETERFTEAVAQMRNESRALESILEIVAGRLEENHARLRGEAERLMSLGDEASDRLGRVTHYLAKESGHLDRQAVALEAAAAAAKVDIGVLLHDLPRAEEQARAVAAAMKEAGLEAHTRAGSLEVQLAALSARGREADETLGGAAERMSAHVARIESSSAAAAATMGEASAGMMAAVDGAMTRAADAVDSARTGLEAQASAMLAAIEQSRAALDSAGADAARSLSGRLDEIGDKIHGLAGHLAAQDAASHAFVSGLAKELAELDRWFDELEQSGTGRTDRLASAIATVRGAGAELAGELAGGDAQAEALSARAEALSQSLGTVAAQLGGALPESLASVEAQTLRTAAAAEALAPLVEGVHATSEGVERRIAVANEGAERLAALMAQQDEAGRALAERLRTELTGLEDSLSRAEAAGGANADRLASAADNLRTTIAALEGELDSSETRARAMADAVQAVSAGLESALPPALARIEAQAGEARAAAESLAPLVEGIEGAATRAASSLAASRDSAAAQSEAMNALLARIEEGVRAADTQLRALGAAAGDADTAAARIVADTGPQLIDALLRVREAAGQAAERAREAISAVIPTSAAALGVASREALTTAVAETVEEQMGILGALAQRSIDAARDASERLTRQMLALGETSAAVEERIDQARREREEADSENFSRRVALLIESLNSTAIDVTKILSNEVTDSAWAAYLKGDRGVFTRRAVRLLDTSQAREIARHYEEEPEFREQVNRYIHDFEAMLRRILADREGSSLGITILSSDMGKLYVALAQAIERLRK